MDPVDVCDAASADLEFVASIIQDYYDENELMMLPASLFYIDDNSENYPERTKKINGKY